MTHPKREGSFPDREGTGKIKHQQKRGGAGDPVRVSYDDVKITAAFLCGVSVASIAYVPSSWHWPHDIEAAIRRVMIALGG